MGKLPFFLLFLSISLTSTLAIRYTNPDQQEQLGECMDVCSRLRFSVEMQHACYKNCEEKYGQGRRSMSDESDELVELVINQGRFDPEMSRKCQQLCRGKGYECQRRCQQHGGRIQEEEDDNQGRFDPEMSHKCQQMCRGKGYECQRRCQQHGGRFQEEEDDNQGRFDPEMSRKCQQICRGKGYECQRRCQRQGGRFQEEDDNEGRFDPEMSRKCQQMCRGKGYECQRRCQKQGGRFQEDDYNEGRFDPEMSRKCQQMCRGKGYECQRRCQKQGGRFQDNDNQVDPQRFAECIARCVTKKGGLQCPSKCMEESQGYRHGGSALLASMLEFTRVFD